MRLAGRFLCAALGLSCIAAAHAQGYPARPIRVLVGFTPGGTTDVVARVIAQKMSDGLRQSVVIDNRPGAGANIAAELAAKAPPDGYTILCVNPGLAISATLYARLGYDALRDLAPVARIADSSHLLVVHPSLPARSIRELIALAKARPGQLNFSSSGVGNADHFAGELFNSMAGIRVVHVPYKGGAQAAQDTVTGQVSMYFSGILVGLPLAKAGKVRALAVATATRSPLAPGMPTIAEAGLPGYEMTLWNAIFAPAATPKEIIARLNTEILKSLQARDVRERLAGLGAAPGGGSPEDLGAYFKGEVEKFGRIVRSLGLRIE
ncbi:MAG: tripartite tricarboxylate transporter substrate binding protein [Burkholderiales bacterium]|nr:tripartite tricarboxylate transporter substrate binding protein [Burkholderiales bacterium]